MKPLVSALLTSALLVALSQPGSLLRHAPPKFVSLHNPLEATADARRGGAKLYARDCAACHGSDREGRGKVPPLNRADVCQAPPGSLFWILRNGSLPTGMPSFAHLPQTQRWQIIASLRNCAEKP